MWSAGAKKIEVYLAAGLALLKEPSKPLISFPHAPTLPLQAVLAQLQAQALAQGISLRNRAIHVCLSARNAPGCALPEYVKVKNGAAGEADQLYFVSKQLNIPSSNLRIQMDADSSDFAAAITLGHMKALDDWALGCGARLQAVRPLWSLATQARRAQPISVKALVLIEPGGMVLLAQPSNANHRPPGDATPARAGQVFEMAANGDAAHKQAQIIQWQSKFQLASHEMVVLSFREKATFRSEPGVSHWSGHWEAA